MSYVAKSIWEQVNTHNLSRGDFRIDWGLTPATSVRVIHLPSAIACTVDDTNDTIENFRLAFKSVMDEMLAKGVIW